MTESGNTASTTDDNPHRPADDTEEVYFEGSPLLRAEMGSIGIAFLIGLILVAIPIIYRIWHGNFPLWWLTLICVLAAIIVGAYPIINRRSLRYRITNYRVDIGTGLLAQNTDTLELWHVEDLRLHQSVLNRILNVGTITVYSHDDTTPQLQLLGLPDPKKLFELMKQRIIAVKRQRGVIKVDGGT